MIHSVHIHARTAAAVAKCVAMKGLDANAPALTALPALNPNQPTHSKHASHAEDDAVRLYRYTWIGFTAAEIRCTEQGRDSGGDMHDSSTCKVPSREFSA